MSTYSGRGLHGQVVGEIGRRIVTGALPQNHTLDLVALETELGISRTSVREALRVLGAKGLVDARQKRGTFVRPRVDWNLLDPDLIRWELEHRGPREILRQLAEVRHIVEPAAAALAAVRRTANDLTALESALTAMTEASTPSEAVAADLQFHRAVLAATGNELLGRMEVVMESVLAERDRIVHGVMTTDSPVPSHRRLLDAIREGDHQAARQRAEVLLSKAMADVDAVTGICQPD